VLAIVQYAGTTALLHLPLCGALRGSAGTLSFVPIDLLYTEGRDGLVVSHRILTCLNFAGSGKIQTDALDDL
jgi:hypothetical protein